MAAKNLFFTFNPIPVTPHDLTDALAVQMTALLANRAAAFHASLRVEDLDDLKPLAQAALDASVLELTHAINVRSAKLTQLKATRQELSAEGRNAVHQLREGGGKL